MTSTHGATWRRSRRRIASGIDSTRPWESPNGWQRSGSTFSPVAMIQRWNRGDNSTSRLVACAAPRRRSAPRVADTSLILLVEALNNKDNPGYFISRSAEGVALIDAVSLPNVRFQHDFYHMQVMEGSLIETFRAIVDRIGHVQVGDAPGRVTPGTGEINLPNVLNAVEESSYRGYIGLEYRPPADGSDPFAWLPRDTRSNRLRT